MTSRILEKYGIVPLSCLLMSYWLIYHETQAKGFKTMVDIEYVQNCPEPEYANIESPITNIKLVKVNRTMQTLNLKLTIKRDWGEDVGLKFDLDIWRYGRWTSFPYVPAQGDICKKFRKMFVELWSVLETKYGIKNCPIPPGEYDISYTNLNSSYAPFKGRFRFRALITSIREREPISCILALFKVEDNVWT